MGNYGKLAALIGTHQEMALFRRFDTLNAKTLLYMQSELVHLEAELSKIELEDTEKEAFHLSFFDLKESSGTGKDLQLRKVLEVREKLKEYNIAIIRYAQIQKLEKPHQRDLSILQEWLDRPEGGDFFLQGREAEIWEMDDLIAVSSHRADKDNFTKLISDKVIPWYHRHLALRFKQNSKATRSWNGLWHYEDSAIHMITNALSTILSSLLPTASILILFLVKSPTGRLAIIVTFITIFSLALVMVTKARRIDVFAATAAFATVQVVFVGGSCVCST